jgi:thymidylate synthase (FAD)
MKVELLHNTPLNICSQAIRTCWDSHDKSDNGGQKDKELIDRVGNKFKHSSTLEHLNYNFYISGISRALLQELARHRIASLSVKSTRYTLKELKDEDEFTENDFNRANKYLVFTDIDEVNIASIKALENLRVILKNGIPNDKAKYCLPENYKTELTWTINARSLQNFLGLRSSKDALWEIRDLANEVFNQIPTDHKYLFEECVN